MDEAKKGTMTVSQIERSVRILRKTYVYALYYNRPRQIQVSNHRRGLSRSCSPQGTSKILHL